MRVAASGLLEGWRIVHRHEISARDARVHSFAGLDMSPAVQTFLESRFPDGLYQHQLRAAALFFDGDNVCVTTPTASGKTLPFLIAGLQAIASGGRVLAIYPLKALARQQEQRWRDAIASAGLQAKVGRLDGDVPKHERSRTVGESEVLIATPDILHAWMLPHLSDTNVRRYLSQLLLMVVDEVHNYTGVFGSNAAFLFRRLQHALGLLGNAAMGYVCTSATIADPVKHLLLLFGKSFVIVGPDEDSSRRHRVTIELVEPPPHLDLMSAVTGLLSNLSRLSHERFIAFVDSRRQAELTAAILARDKRRRSPDDTAEERPTQHLGSMDILPFRAGYEEEDRSHILERLNTGQLRGVVTTSALELGLDIAHLTTGILIGVPRSSTSLWQRIGRIGRDGPGRVFIVNTRDVHDAWMFRRPEGVLQAPPAEGALYLENRRIQYIHALCLAREGEGEHDILRSLLGQSGDDVEFGSPVGWPRGFLELCRAERAGEIPSDLHSMKIEGGDVPHLQFPLRDTEVQFAVRQSGGPYRRDLGSLSFAQVMREAYPGAVYYYAAQPYRVHTVMSMSRRVDVRREKTYTTNPQRVPPLIYPNLLSDNVLQSVAFGQGMLIESSLQVRDVIVGIKERRGSVEESIPYPIPQLYTRNSFSRNYFTTGVVLYHPALERPYVEREKVAELLHEGLLAVVPFERQDIGWAHDRFRVERGSIKKGAPFVAVFDQTYGSLRLSARLMEEDVMRQVVEEAWLMASAGDESVREETVRALETIMQDLVRPWQSSPFGGEAAAATEDRLVPIIVPGSRGWALNRNNQEFKISEVYYTPKGLMYRGQYVDEPNHVEDVTISWNVDTVAPIPGESRMGYYDLHTGEVVDEE